MKGAQSLLSVHSTYEHESRTGKSVGATNTRPNQSVPQTVQPRVTRRHGFTPDARPSGSAGAFYEMKRTMMRILQRYFASVARKSNVRPQALQKEIKSLSKGFDKLKVFKL
jgi:hypothetical protein